MTMRTEIKVQNLLNYIDTRLKANGDGGVIQTELRDGGFSVDEAELVTFAVRKELEVLKEVLKEVLLMPSPEKDVSHD